MQNSKTMFPNIGKDIRINELVKKQTKPLTQALDNKAAESFRNCFIDNQNNSQNFANCLQSFEEKIKKIHRSMKYDGLFMSTSYQVCIAQNKKDKNQCFQEFKNLLLKQKQKWESSVKRI